MTTKKVIKFRAAADKLELIGMVVEHWHNIPTRLKNNRYWVRPCAILWFDNTQARFQYSQRDLPIRNYIESIPVQLLRCDWRRERTPRNQRIRGRKSDRWNSSLSSSDHTKATAKGMPSYLDSISKLRTVRFQFLCKFRGNLVKRDSIGRF
jgi:hypothetical protein